jgi:hypothetical protein
MSATKTNAIIRKYKAQTYDQQTQFGFDIIALAKQYRAYHVANTVWAWLMGRKDVSMTMLFGDYELFPNYDTLTPEEEAKVTADFLATKCLVSFPTSQEECEWSEYHSLMILSWKDRSACIPAPLLCDEFWKNAHLYSIKKGWRNYDSENCDGAMGTYHNFWVTPENIEDYLFFFEEPTILIK